MSDNMKESLSAWIDGEASEIEVHRLLREFEGDESLKSSWASYIKVRAVIRRERHLANHDHLALHERISAAIRSEESIGVEPELPKHRGERRYVTPIATMAVAASLVAAVFVGITLQSPPEQAPVAVASPPATAAPQVIQTRPVSTGSEVVASFEPENPESDLRELDEEQQRRLRAYLNQHDRMVRMNPNVRTVIFDAQGNK